MSGVWHIGPLTHWPYQTRLCAHRWQRLYLPHPSLFLSMSHSVHCLLPLSPAPSISVLLWPAPLPSFWPREITLTPMGWMLPSHFSICGLCGVYIVISSGAGRMSWALSAWGALSPTSIVCSLLYSREIMSYNSWLSYSALQSGRAICAGVPRVQYVCVYKCWGGF